MWLCPLKQWLSDCCLEPLFGGYPLATIPPSLPQCPQFPHLTHTYTHTLNQSNVALICSTCLTSGLVFIWGEYPKAKIKFENHSSKTKDLVTILSINVRMHSLKQQRGMVHIPKEGFLSKINSEVLRESWRLKMA